MQLEHISQSKTDSRYIDQLYVNYVLKHITNPSWQNFRESVELSRNFCYQIKLDKKGIVTGVESMAKCAEETCCKVRIGFRSLVDVSFKKIGGLIIPTLAELFWGSCQLKSKYVDSFNGTNRCETAQFKRYLFKGPICVIPCF